MSALVATPKVVRQNFPGDREYTLEGMKEEFALMERHLRDGSWRLCNCNPEKHLPLIAGFSSEGFGFAEGPEEKEFMRIIRDSARIWRSKIKEGRFTDVEADQLRAWAREMRHRIEFRNWSGPLEETPELTDVVLEINALTGDLMKIEERHLDEVLTELSRSRGIPKPKYRFINRCDPLNDAFAVGRDLIIKSEDGETRQIPLTEMDELVFCRGSTSPYAVAHEWCHYEDRVRDGSTNEASATRCALDLVGNEVFEERTIVNRLGGGKSIYSLSLTGRSGGIMPKKARLMDAAPIVAGVVAGELVDETGMLATIIAQIPVLSGYPGLAKAALGGLAVWVGLVKAKGMASDFILGMGLPLVAGGLIEQFYTPAPTVARARAAAQRLTPYARPTGLRYGYHPTLAQTKFPPRPGVLAPSGIPQSLAGKWMLGGPVRGGPGSGRFR